MITCTRRIQFAFGHRVLGHENKCGSPHGHNGVVFFTAQAEGLDGVGRVIDFSVLKEKLGGWIDRYWDHGFLIFDRDHEMLTAFAGRDWKVAIVPFNPTAENIASQLLRVVGPAQLAGTGVRLVSVVVHETENGQAEASL